MAKPAWLHTNKTSGSNNGTVEVSSLQPHTGRTARSGILTFKAAGVSNQTVTVNQAGKPEWVEITESISIPRTGGGATLTGKSNSAKLTFSLGTGSLQIVIPAQYRANSLNTNNGANISGDPGAAQEYSFEITLPSVGENADTQEKTRQVIVAANGGQQDICVVTQAAGENTLTVTPFTITLDWTGGKKTVTVQSNTNWTVS